jgi:hypothetical protein
MDSKGNESKSMRTWAEIKDEIILKAFGVERIDAGKKEGSFQQTPPVPPDGPGV